MERERFLDSIVNQFNTTELKTLCFGLAVEYEDLSGDSKTAKCIELILYLQRRGRLADLVTACENARPNVDWRELGGFALSNAFLQGASVADIPSFSIETSSPAVPIGAPKPGSTPVRSSIFVSYSHKDKEWLERLHNMLRPMVRGNVIRLWDDTRIHTGNNWRRGIDQALLSAKVGVILVSPNFLASDFIANVELPYLLQAAEREGLQICWALLSECLYETTRLTEFQAAHNIETPLDTLNEAQRNVALAKIARDIKQLVDR
jgi:hypothetical protein